MTAKTAVLMDGGFVKKKVAAAVRRFPTVADVVAIAETAMAKPPLAGAELFRVYFYDAPPYEGQATNPIDGSSFDFSSTTQARQNQRLLQALEMQPYFAVRQGVLNFSGWKLGTAALASLAKTPRPITGGDLVPDIGQKGVDMRIGLDIAWLSLKRIVDAVVLVTGDSDFVPAMKFARREGIRVFWKHSAMGCGGSSRSMPMSSFDRRAYNRSSEVIPMAQERTSSVLWFVAGAALGATVALLYAPHSGRHTRYLIKQRAKQGVDKIGEYSSDIADKSRELYDRGKAVADEAAEIFERGKRLVEG